MTSTTPDPRVLRLTALLQLEHEARQADNATELGFIMVNETHRLLSYQQASFWTLGSTGSVKIEAVSGLAQLERDAPFLVWLRYVVKYLSAADQSHTCRVVTPAEIPEKYRSDWNEWCPGGVVWCPFVDRNGALTGGLWVTRTGDWEEGEVTLLQRLTEAYSHAWQSLQSVRGRSGVLRVLRGRGVRLLLLVAVLGAMFLPVRLSVLAPADVIPIEPVIVSSAIEGVIAEIHVRPNQPVAAGDPLFSLDDAALSSRHQVAQKALAVAQADYLRAAQKAFSDTASKAEVAMRKAVVDQKAAEVEYTNQLLQRVVVRAPRAGIVVFSDANDWLGKPVVVGEKVMTVADPARTELQIWVPVGDAINLEPGAEVKVFLNTDPTQPLAASLYQGSYEAQLNPSGVLAFQAKARFDGQTAAPPRIGLKGTAKIFGEQVRLGYYLLRRPLAAGRQLLGL